MSNIPSELKYIASHEWVRLEEDGKVTIGITEHAQELLGDIVYVELPEIGSELGQEDTAGVVESVKAASDIYSPVSGKVVEVNEELVATPELANSSPYEAGWFFVIEPSNPEELTKLLTATEYAAEIN